MKICVVTSQYGDYWSGLGTYATNLINGFAAAGHTVSVICPSADRSKAHPGVIFLDSTSITVKPLMSSWIMLAWQANQLVQKLLPEHGFDVVHFADAREALFCRSNKALIVGTMNDYYFVEADKNPLYYKKYYSDWLMRWLFYNLSRVFEKRAIRALPLVLANTGYVTASLIKNYGASTGQVHTVYYGLGPPPAIDFSASALEGSPSILFVGSNFQRKGLPVLVRAMEYVVKRHPAALLHVIGKDSKQKAIEQIASQAGIQNNVRFYGGMENTKVQALYPRAQIFAMPSLVEGFGLVFLEAMAAGTPVIGGLCGGTPELIRDGENGFVVAPDQPKILADRIMQLAANPALRERFARAGKASYDEYSIARMINSTIALYQQFKVSS